MIESFLRHLQHEKRLSDHTVTAYRGDLHQFCRFLTGHPPHTEITTASHTVIRAWIVELVETGRGPASVNRKIACLRRYFRFLLAEGVIQTDPMARIQVLKTAKRLPQFVREDDMVKLLDNAAFPATFEGRRDQLILEMLYGTGIRRAELIGLRDHDVDLRERTLKVLGKRNKQRIVPFPAPLAALITEYLAVRQREVENRGNGMLFVRSNGEPCSPSMIYKIVNRYLATLPSVEKRSPHVLRHTYATHLLNEGAELNAVKDLLGHASLAATQVYTHNSLEKLRKVFEQAHPKA